MAVDPQVVQWRKDGKHLPPFMRDFHDQKDLFKTIQELYGHKPTDDHLDVNWVQAHAYTIDRFLWFMAHHGYTLQKSRSKLPFTDVQETLDTMNERRMAAGAAELNEYFAQQKAKKETTDAT